MRILCIVWAKTVACVAMLLKGNAGLACANAHLTFLLAQVITADMQYKYAPPPLMINFMVKKKKPGYNARWTTVL